MSTVMNRYVALLITLSLCVVACDSGNNATNNTGPSTTKKILSADDGVAAQTAVKQMLLLAQAKDWQTLVDSYLAPSEYKTPAEKKKIVDEMPGYWAGQFVIVLEEAGSIKPLIKDDEALFQEDGQTIYTLYEYEKGKWGFKL